MRMKIAAAVFAATIPVLSACADDSLLERSRNDDVQTVEKDDPAMLAAFDKARATLDDFLARAAAPAAGTDGYSLKVAVRDGEQVEYFWVAPFEVLGGDRFSGTLANTPRLVTTVREGQTIEFRRADIHDWTYFSVSAKRMYGNFTACAMLVHESPEDAAAFRREYGLRCED